MRSAVLPLVGCAFLSAGCSSVKPPAIGVQSARVTKQSTSATVVMFEVLAENGDHRQLPLTDVRYEVWINGAQAFAGRRFAETTLPGFGSQTLELPAAIASEIAPGAAYRITGELSYRPPSFWRETLNDAGLPFPSVSFSGEGSITP